MASGWPAEGTSFPLHPREGGVATFPPALGARVLAGGTDEEILDWAQQTGRPLSEEDLVVWNSFLSKRGWNDEATPILEKYKAAGGLAHRTDLVTMFDLFDVDEGRKP